MTVFSPSFGYTHSNRPLLRYSLALGSSFLSQLMQYYCLGFRCKHKPGDGQTALSRLEGLDMERLRYVYRSKKTG